MAHTRALCVDPSRAQTFFERSSAELIKPSTPYVVEEGMNTGRELWAMAIDSSVIEIANEGRLLPLAPAGFSEQLRAKRFTNDADADAVAARRLFSRGSEFRDVCMVE